MFEVRFKGLRLIPSKSSSDEMIKLGLMLYDCKNLLEKGHKAPRKRAKYTEEIWSDKGNKTYNLVIVKLFNHFYNEEVYVITHLGIFTKR